MINFSALNSLFNAKNKQIGELSGELFDIYRPNYSAQDNIPALVHTQVRYRRGLVKAKSFAEPYIPNNSLYDIFGNRSLLQPGDMLVRGNLTAPELTFPAVTISHLHDQRALEGFRTARRCHIVNSYNADDNTYDYVHKNVYFDMLGTSFPHGQLVDNYAKSGESIPSQKAILFNRPAIDKEGMQLIETDYSGVPNGNKWIVEQIDIFGPFMVLSLDANWRR